MLSVAEVIRDEKITVYRSSVSTFRALTRTLKEAIGFPHLRLIILHGEPVYRSDVEAYRKYFDDQCVLVSSLGVSELGDYAHYFIDKSSHITTPIVPGGYPLAHTDITLLDFTDRPNPNLKEGEIGVQGPYVGVNAWRRPDLQNAMFAANLEPLTYKTGDLGCIRKDGCIIHLGRKDFQIKVRGNRVDLGEVEAALHEIDSIAQAAANGYVDPRGDVQLVGYLVSDSIVTLSIAKIREKLKMTLPDYMIPSIFVELDALPFTLTGKVDRRSLPVPDSVRSVNKTFRKPEGIIQEQLVAIWKDVLRIDQFGTNEQFLDLGGDSLKAMMIVARVVKGFQLDRHRNKLLKALLGAGTIVQMAEIVERYLDNRDPAARQ